MKSLGVPVPFATPILIMSWCLASPALAQEEPGAVKTAVLRAVVLARTAPDPNGQRRLGTGFLVSDVRPDTAPPLRRTFLVTNKHMLGDWNPADGDIKTPHPSIDVCFYTASGPPNPPCKWLTISLVTAAGLLDSRKVKLHPIAVADVAAVEIGADVAGDQDLDDFSFDRSYLLQFNRLPAFYLGLGDQVFALGYPAGVRSLTNNYPVAKAGYLAALPGEELEVETNWKSRAGTMQKVVIRGKLVLVDGLIVPGNSGGPLVMISGIRPRVNDKGVLAFLSKPLENLVIGIVSSGLSPSGLTVVYSSDYVLEVVDAFLAVQER